MKIYFLFGFLVGKIWKIKSQEKISMVLPGISSLHMTFQLIAKSQHIDQQES